jgi:hypothetical protein
MQLVPAEIFGSKVRSWLLGWLRRDEASGLLQREKPEPNDLATQVVEVNAPMECEHSKSLRHVEVDVGRPQRRDRVGRHLETTCVRNLGRSGIKDWDLMPLVIAGGFTLVTNNSKDFRGRTPGQPGGLHAKEEIHTGLVCLNTDIGMDIDKQRELL